MQYDDMTGSPLTPAKQKIIVDDFPFNYIIIENQWIPLADGIRLSSRIWLPQVPDGQKVPAILEYIPYRKTDGTRTRDEPMHGYFAGHGYACVRVDLRGSGESDGLLEDEYLSQEQSDALEVLAWMASQPWCDGNIGMMGKSWGGFNSLQVAALKPPNLKAVITLGFTDDRYADDIHYKGGCLLNDNFWWGSIMLAYQMRPIDPTIAGDNWREKWLNRLEHMPLWMKTWMEHPLRDAYWAHGSVCEDYRAIKAPVLALDGWEDAYTNTVLSLMRGLDVPRKAIIGPWAHVYPHDGVPGPAIGFLQEAVAWWDHWLKGRDNGAMDGPMVTAWIEESMPPSSSKPISNGYWVGVESWPSTAVSIKRYGMRHGRLLESSTGRGESLQLKTPLTHGLFAGSWMGVGVLGESPADQRMDDGMAMTFDSAPLEAPLVIFGYPRFEVELSSDTPVAMLVARICDVAPTGEATRVSYGVMNLGHLRGHDRLTPLKPGEKVAASVTLDCCGHHFEAGHRIRLSLATGYWPMFWPMPEQATFTLDTGTATLSLPVFTGTRIPGPDPQPASAPPTRLTMLANGTVNRTLIYDAATDAWTCTLDGVGGVFGEGVYRFDDIDVTVEHNLKQVLTLSNTDPLSNRHTVEQKIRMGREGWWIEGDITTRLAATEEHFTISGHMDVTENGKLVFSRRWNETVRRIDAPLHVGPGHDV